MDTIQRIQKAFGDDAVNAAQIKVWHECFKNGWESVESDPHSGRPAASRTSENVERVWAAINKDQRLAVRELEVDQGIPRTTVSNILMQYHGMKCVVEKFVPWILLPEQEEHCAAVANDSIQTTTNEPDFPKKVITGDEPWVHGCALEMKTQSSQRKLPGSQHLKKVRQSRSKTKDHVLNSGRYAGELCEALRCLLWRGLRCHHPMHNVSYILYLLQ